MKLPNGERRGQEPVHASERTLGYLAVSIGFLIGRVKIAGFTLGSVTGVLITALIIGQLDIPVSPGLKSVFFSLFVRGWLWSWP